MSVTLSQEQFKELLVVVTAGARAPKQESNGSETKRKRTLNDPAALGPMRKCFLGSNKMARLKIFDEWLEEASNRMEYIGDENDKDKITLLKSWGGSELVDFMKT